MKQANGYFFFSGINAGISASFDLNDPTLKQFEFKKENNKVRISANVVDNVADLVYACFSGEKMVCDSSGTIPKAEIYTVITAIVNDFLK